MCALTDVDLPAKRDEYHRWYLEVHFPDLIEPGQFANPTMFLNAGDPVPEGDGYFLAMYETHHADLEATAVEFKKLVDQLFAESRIHAGTIGRMFAIYRQLGVHLAGPERRRRTQSLIAVHIDAEAGAEDELRRWYREQHVPEVVETGLVHTGSINELIGGDAFADAMEPDQPRFLAQYESDIGDPAALAGMLAEKHPADAMPEFVKLRRVGLYYRGSA